MMSALAPTLPAPHDPRGLGGLLALADGAELALPLREVKVRTRIAGNLCRTVIEQRYGNDRTVPVEAVHLFPVPENAAIVGMELAAGELVVKAELRERKDAEAVFAAAREQGHRAALLTAERADVHTLRVTMLPPGEEVRVRIELVELLDAVDGRFRWRFPTTIAPRYVPGTPTGREGAVPDTDRAPHASRLQPPLRLAGGTKLDLEVVFDGPVRALASSLHAVQVEFDGGVRVAPSGTTTLDRDFVLAFSVGTGVATAARAWTDGTHTAIVVEPPDVPGDGMPRDAVFVVDISGSMGGTKLDAAKRALVAALHGLVPGDRFALIAFDDRLERFASGLSPYDDRTVQKADRWIGALQARGGTDMLPALQAALEEPAPEGRVRTVLFITDGQAHNDDELVACVSGRSGRSRVFTLGIDTAVNGALLQRLARAGGGACELATPNDDVEAVIAKVEARFGAPLVEELKVEGAALASLATPALFAGRPATLLVEGAAASVRVTGSGGFGVDVPVERADAPVATLWAKARIEALEDRRTTKPWEEEAARAEILRLSLAHGLASRHTAWVAVERSRRVDGTPVEVVQPAELPSGWDESFRAGPSGGGVRQRGFGGAPGAAPMLARASAPPPPPSPVVAPMPAKSAKRSGFLGKIVDAMSAPAMSAPSPMADEAPKESLFVRDSADAGYDADPAGGLARSQRADGSFDGGVLASAAALLALVLLGHTRQAGVRTRTVRKLAAWLDAHRSDPAAAAALAALAEREAGAEPTRTPAWDLLIGVGGPVGSALSAALHRAGVRV